METSDSAIGESNFNPLALQPATKKTTVWQCSICNKFFASKYTLQDHQRIHTGEKPYVCNMCPKRFRARPNLSTHMKGHLGTKPFMCVQCRKSFATKQQMQVHERVHSGERPFACDICSRRFTTLGNMKQHRLSHSNERPFVCEHCKKGFTSRGSLTNHARTARCPALKALPAPPLALPMSGGSPTGSGALVPAHSQNISKMDFRCLKQAAPVEEALLSQGGVLNCCDSCGMRFSDINHFNVHRQQGPCSLISRATPTSFPVSSHHHLHRHHLIHHHHHQSSPPRNPVTSGNGPLQSPGHSQPEPGQIDRLQRLHGDSAVASLASPVNGLAFAANHASSTFLASRFCATSSPSPAVAVANRLASSLITAAAMGGSDPSNPCLGRSNIMTSQGYHAPSSQAPPTSSTLAIHHSHHIHVSAHQQQHHHQHHSSPTGPVAWPSNPQGYFDHLW